MIVIYSRNGIPIRLTQERWEHITRRHPEMAAHNEKIKETISNPDLIQEGDFGEFLALRLYSVTPATKKYLVIAYKEIAKQDGFILTAYFTNSPLKRRRIVWKR